MGVWIEILYELLECARINVTPCVGVWIEIDKGKERTYVFDSHSLRGSVD